MRAIYLVAMRDYMGYVSAWGFWLGLLFTPLILGIFILAPSFAANSQPTRYYTVLEQDTQFSEAMQAKQDQQSSVLPQSAPELGERAFEVKKPYIYVTPPAPEMTALKPYLRGERLIETPDGPQPLFAVIVVPEEGPIEYWSENLQAQDLLSIASQAEEQLKTDEIFARAGVRSTLLKDAELARRKIIPQRTRDAGEPADSKVTTADRAPFIMSVMMAFSLWFLIFSVINYLLMGTIEERSNKIFDSLLTSVKLPQMLSGKLIAVLMLSLTLMAFWGLGSATLTFFARDQIPPQVASNLGTVLAAGLKPTLIIPAIISFVLGYLMYGSLFLALGSLCDTIQEAQTLMTPLFVLLMAPLAMLAFAVNDAQSPLIETMAWVPVFTPFLLILRMPTEPPLWEVVTQLGIMSVTAFTILYLAARVYRAGAVHGAGVNDVWAFFGKLVPGRKTRV